MRPAAAINTKSLNKSTERRHQHIVINAHLAHACLVRSQLIYEINNEVEDGFPLLSLVGFVLTLAKNKEDSKRCGLSSEFGDDRTALLARKLH